jgi:SAM-dependent methyltransferase
MIDLLELHKHFIAPHIRPHAAAVDCTMGNGNDTLALSRMMGETGRVYAFDIQAQALENTKKLLEAENAPENYTLILDSHAEILRYIPENEDVCCVMFNLGWLPGADHSTFTLRESTMRAVEGAVKLLAPDGIILVAVYPGHPEGKLEGEMLYEYFGTFDRRQWCVSRVQIINSPTSPYFFAAERK